MVAEKQRLSSELSEAIDDVELAKKENDGLKRSLNELNSKWEANKADFGGTQGGFCDQSWWICCHGEMVAVIVMWCDVMWCDDVSSVMAIWMMTMIMMVVMTDKNMIGS